MRAGFRPRSRQRPRVFDTPMRRHRMTDPYRAGFAVRAITDGEDEIHFGRAWLCEDVPALRREASRRIAECVQFLQGMRIDFALWLTARGESPEAPAPFLVEDGFGENGTCGVARAQEEHVVGLVGHGRVPWLGRRSVQFHDRGRCRADARQLTGRENGGRHICALDHSKAKAFEERCGGGRRQEDCRA